MLIEHLSLFCFAFFNFMGIKTPFGLILVYFPPFFSFSIYLFSDYNSTILYRSNE